MKPSSQYIAEQVSQALQEDIGSGDISAQLLPQTLQAQATIYSREKAVLCGCDWLDQAMQQVDKHINIQWFAQDGDLIEPNQKVCQLSGLAQSLVTAERTALNFVQTLSGVATKAYSFVEMVKHTQVKLLDTRKTIPGLRVAQKYATSVGGCYNHRIGLYDAFLIKENHIAGSSSIASIVNAARTMQPNTLLEIEVENIKQLQQAIAAQVDRILLDNFTLEEIKEAVQFTNGRIPLEASGNVDEAQLPQLAQTGVDYISIGSLTKHIQAVDLSLRLYSL